MRKACIVVSPFYRKNRIFDIENKTINRDNCMYFYYILKKAFEKVGIDLATSDINSIIESDIVIYNDMPEKLPQKNDIKKSYLLIFESEVIIKRNWDLNKHVYFNKIFTWNDLFIDNKKYFKFNFNHKIPKQIIEKTIKKNLCTLIAGNKMKKDEKELYSERLKAIKWFEKNKIKDFEFYGMGWDKYTFKKPFHYLNKLQLLRKIFAKRFSSYKGVISEKIVVLSKYKFCICYENAKSIQGYITEKIFDCFFAGCVPIYLGAPNILDYIPRECFIDRNKYNSYEELYKYIKFMDEETYSTYINSIKKFIISNEIKIFSSEKNVEIIIKEIIK